MANFDKTDSHFVVFFHSDKSVHTLQRSKIEEGDCDDTGKVKIMWKTSKISEDGTEVIEDMPYDGVVLFSGSSMKCRTFLREIQQTDLSKDGELNKAIKFGIEIKSTGRKRGANTKLKRALEEEKNDVIVKKPKLKDTKMKEIMAFAGLHCNNTRSPSKTKTPTMAETETGIPSESTGSPARTKTPAKRQATIETRTPSKNTKSPSKPTTPTKRQTRSPSKTETPIKRQTTTETETRTPSKSKRSPTKTPTKRQTRSPSKTETPTKRQATAETETRTLSKSTRSPAITKTPTKTVEKNTPSKNTAARDQVKSKTPNKKQRAEEGVGTCHQYQDISGLVGDSLGILNYDNNFDQYAEDFTPGDSSTPNSTMITPLPPLEQQVYEYGYNTNDGNLCQNKPDNPFQSVIDYYSSLPHEAQNHVINTFQLFISALHQSTHGFHAQHAQNEIKSAPVQTDNPCMTLHQRPEKKLPLIKDDDGTYDDVLVNPSSLRTAEMKAAQSKNKGVYLLNKVLELVFSKEELKDAKGVKGLDNHKMDALREYMYARCLRLGIDQVPPKTVTIIIQNKIGNARKASEKIILKKKDMYTAANKPE